MSIFTGPIKVERIAYRKNAYSPWDWFGPIITFPFVLSPQDWHPQYKAIESLCKSLRDYYDTLEDYCENVKIMVASHEDAFTIHDLNQKTSPLPSSFGPFSAHLVIHS